MFSFFKKSKSKIEIKTSDKISKGISSIFNSKKIDEESLEELEALLIKSDVNFNITNNIVSSIRNTKFKKEVEVKDIKDIIFNKLNTVLNSACFCDKKQENNNKPHVILFLGVNGSGKTTIIGKLANQIKKNEGGKVLLAACDTFRAGAREQLKIWAERSECDIYFDAREGVDPASVAYKALEKAKNEGYDYLLIDTAGRLQNNINLMNELKKIITVLKKIDDTKPDETLIVLDASTGQHSIKQMEEFSKNITIDGIIMNKLDGTSKGGALISIIDAFKKPIFAVGMGEKIEDIRDFDNTEFLQEILGLKDE